ncbi:MAG: TetR/AcrR family transcriptional regulator C-terminal domain-containing protein [Acidimicrobiia bacterium]|nr:TetR/AcrR family transcriptional regulator C-terminal domain-containing protein [Acidimicrobiia bacterium]
MRATDVTAAVPGSPTWWLERQAREARRRPRADGLSTERIVDAALALVDAEGLDALTVRRLAEELHTGSASLYRHVASRDELLVLLVDHVLGEVRHPPDGTDGRATVEVLSNELRRVLMDHHNLVPALTVSPLFGPNALLGTERGLAGLLDAGFPPDVAVPAYLALVDFVLGTVFFDTSSTGQVSGLTHERHELLAAFPADAFALLRARPDDVSLPSVDDVFAFGLATFLDGLEHRFLPSDGTAGPR